MGSEGLGCPPKPEGRAPRRPPSGARSPALHPTPSLLAGPFPVSPLGAGATLNPAACWGPRDLPRPQGKEHGAGSGVTSLRLWPHTKWSRDPGDNLRRWSLTSFHISLTDMRPRGPWSASRPGGTCHPGELPVLWQPREPPGAPGALTRASVQLQRQSSPHPTHGPARDPAVPSGAGGGSEPGDPSLLCQGTHCGEGGEPRKE